MSAPLGTDESANSSGNIDVPGLASQTGPVRRASPRLRTHHFMLWTAATALLLMVPRSIGSREFEPQGLGFEQAWIAVWTILLAVDVTILALGIRWRSAGMAFFDQPGHWIALDGATAVLPWLLSMSFETILPRSSGYWVFALFYFLRSVALSLVFVWVGRRIADTRRWKAYCWTRAAIVPLVVILTFIQWQTRWPYYAVQLVLSVLIVLLIACAVNDWQRRAARHWSHWAVVGAHLIGSVLQTVTMLVGWLGGLG